MTKKKKKHETIKEQEDWVSPKTLDEYIGQVKAKEIGSVIVDSAFEEKRNISNILISGSYGLGKSTLGKLLFEKHNTLYYEHNAASLSILKSLYYNGEVSFSSGSYLIDEIHNIPTQLSDMMHQAMDAGNISIIGMTTSPGQLSGPFRSRFTLIQLEPYTVDDLVKIIANVVERRGKYSLSEESFHNIAQRSKQTARTAIQYTKFIFDLANVYKVSDISEALVEEAFGKLRVDSKGLTEIDHKYLAALPEERPVGIQYLAAKLGIDAQTIEEEIEPFLMREGYIDRSNRGRFKLEPDLEDRLRKSIEVQVLKRYGRGKVDDNRVKQ